MKINVVCLIILLLLGGIITACGDEAKGGNEQASTAQSGQGKTESNADQKPAEDKAQAEIPQTEMVNVFDGRNEPKENEETPAEKLLINKEFKLKKSVIMQKINLQCDEGTEEGVSIVGSAEGSFTKPESRQKVFLYEHCRSGRAFGIGGIMVIENGKVVAHYSYGENGLDSGIFALPDVNKNGLSEIVLIAYGSGQGYTNAVINLFEFKAGNFDFLGGTQVYDDNSGAVENELKAETTAYRISVQPSGNPAFFRDKYQKKGAAKNWSLIKKSEKFALDKDDPGVYIKIS